MDREHDRERDVEESTDVLADRRAAVAELGAELRALVEAAVRTEVAPDELRHVAKETRRLTERLGERQREVTEVAAVDDLSSRVRMYNPVIGDGHPVAPPIDFVRDGDEVTGHFTLGAMHEGPPSCSHGGMSALFLDQALGHAAATIGAPGVTTDLKVRYLRPVPLGEPLRIWSKVTEASGNRTHVRGVITTAAEPGTALVESEGRFMRLSRAQLERIFPDLVGKHVSPGSVHD
ncbi:PaaI family thioesterase [Haloechinothrix halophila]|uniref:PaaI family thioesterase n=1 Tax=Haloechinothrix halophila TaxID=1069073 RepID=UPI000421FAF7|nr:PaaI family thioesterase [Haloechinothrix halophila]